MASRMFFTVGSPEGSCGAWRRLTVPMGIRWCQPRVTYLAPGRLVPMAAIDLNSDVGESFGRWKLGDDEAVLALVTSANVACGFHAGDPRTLRLTCETAAERGVVVGAQVGYRDLAGFGRRFIDVDPLELTDDIVYQVGALQALAAVAGSRV